MTQQEAFELWVRNGFTVADLLRRFEASSLVDELYDEWLESTGQAVEDMEATNDESES